VSQEVYMALSGSATVHAGGSSYRLEPGVFIRIGPGELRKVTTGNEPVQLLALGAVPGHAYAPPPFTEEGVALPG
jgi:mannose-6-phosphate isomerase-like protein (cupin superfamily)